MDAQFATLQKIVNRNVRSFAGDTLQRERPKRSLSSYSGKALLTASIEMRREGFFFIPTSSLRPDSDAARGTSQSPHSPRE